MTERKRTIHLVAGLMAMGITAPAAGQEATPYLGAQVGLDDFDIETASPPADAENAQGTGFEGFLGIRRDMPAGVFGLEGSIGYSDARFEATRSGTKSVVEAEESYGVSVLYGPEFGDALVYARGGWQWTSLRVQQGSQEKERDFNGPRFGLGTEVEVYASVKFRLEWTRTLYGEQLERFGDIDPARSSIRAGITVPFGGLE